MQSAEIAGPLSIIPILPHCTPLPSLMRLAIHPPSPGCRRHKNPGLREHRDRRGRKAELPPCASCGACSSAHLCYSSTAFDMCVEAADD